MWFNIVPIQRFQAKVIRHGLLHCISGWHKVAIRKFAEFVTQGRCCFAIAVLKPSPQSVPFLLYKIADNSLYPNKSRNMDEHGVVYIDLAACPAGGTCENKCAERCPERIG